VSLGAVVFLNLFGAWGERIRAGESSRIGALRHTALARERAMGQNCVRRVGDVPIGGRRGLGEGMGLSGCRDERQGI
jgi:hypothetical protein